LQCALVDPEENKIGWRRRLPTFAPKQIFKALFTTPRRRNKWDARKKVTENDYARPRKADEAKDQEPMTPEPVHAGVYEKKDEARMSNVEGSPNAQMTKAGFCHSDFVIPSSLGIRHLSLIFGCHSRLATYCSSLGAAAS